jgi:predicted O-methyltransferase YrrM
MLNHQLHFLKDAIQYVRPGGLLIIEDIFRAIPAARFQEALDVIKKSTQCGTHSS